MNEKAVRITYWVMLGIIAVTIGWIPALIVGIMMLPFAGMYIAIKWILSANENWGTPTPSSFVSQKRMWRK